MPPAHFPEFRFCPLCRGKLRRYEICGRTRLACSRKRCNFVHWDGPKPAAVARVVIDGKLLLVQRGAAPAIGSWCLPGGFVEAQESGEDAAGREVHEEAGVRVKITRLIGAYSPCHGVNELILVYDGEVIGGSVMFGDDASDAKLFGPDELPENIAFDQHRKVIDAWKHHVTLAPHDLDCVSTPGAGKAAG
jgi:ADP-ribose pyrophosphatase YjhB (NUDIX family)